jgi:putative (di)nucleoside polyphosphate hydrolase
VSEKPYRPNVGVALFSREGLVFAGHRFASSGPELIDPATAWQMPQGGIDEGEDIIAAARRELWEETGVTSVSLLGATEDWWTYDFPPYDGPTTHKLAPFRGQQQRWVAFRMEGGLDEIQMDVDGCTEDPEFDAWGFFPLSVLPRLVVDFRRPVYEKVAEAFAGFSAPANGSSVS